MSHPALAFSSPDTPQPRLNRRQVLSRTLISLCAVGLPLGTFAQTPAPDAFAAAFALFTRAAGGDETRIEPAAEAFTALLRQQPTDVVLMAYAGAATAMRARTTLLPWKKMRYADDGLAQLDKALQLLTPAHDAPAQRGVPAQLEVKFTAASTFLALPGLFNRHERGLKLLADVAQHPLLKSSPTEFQAAVAAAQRKHQER